MRAANPDARMKMPVRLRAAATIESAWQRGPESYVLRQ